MKLGTLGMRKFGAMVVATSVAVLLVACGDFAEKSDSPAPAPAPNAVTTTGPDAAVMDRTPASSDAAVTVDSPLSCSDANALTPRATFNADKLAFMHPITPIDVYAYELGDVIDDGVHPVHAFRSLRIVVTEQADECALRRSRVIPQALNALTYEIRRDAIGATLPAVIGAGVYSTEKPANPDVSVSFLQDWGARCALEDAKDSSTPDEVFGVGDPVFGSIAIDARTELEIEGTITLNGSGGKQTHLTFKAPICAPSIAKDSPICCAKP